MSIKIELPIERSDGELVFWNIDMSKIDRIEEGPACLDSTTCWVYLNGNKWPLYCKVPKEEITL